jgi:transcriptional regulator with XRE-family HTH domain
MFIFVHENAKFMESIANTIKIRRKELGYRQEDLASKVGISTVQYCYFENGKRNLSFSAFERVMGALGLNMILTEFDFNKDDLINLAKLLKK